MGKGQLWAQASCGHIPNLKNNKNSQAPKSWEITTKWLYIEPQ